MATLTLEEIALFRSHDTDDRRMPFIVGNAVCLFVAYLAVVLRFLSRRVSRSPYGADDFLVLAGLIVFTGFASILFLTLRLGMGRHVFWMTDFKGFAKASLAAEVLYNSSIPIIKLSILCLYRRIFPQRWFSYTLMCLGAFVIAYSVASIFADVFQCVPTNSIWEREKAKFCINYPALIISTGVINVLTDIILLALPIPILWGLNMSLARKRLLTMLFLMGGLVCIVSIVRLFFVDRVGNTQDPPWDYVLPSTISTVEICVGIVSACLPTYRPLFRYVRPTKRGCDSVGKWKTADIYSLGQGSPDIPLRTITSSQKNHVSVQDDEEQLFRQGRNDIYV